MSAGLSWPEDDVPFFIHLCEAPDFDKGQDCWPLRDSVFIPMCNKRYISKPKNKEIGSVSRKTDSPMLLLLAPIFLAEFPSGAWMLFHVIQVIQPPFLHNLPTTLSISNLSLSVIKYVFFQRRRLHPHLRITLDPPGLDPGRHASSEESCSRCNYTLPNNYVLQKTHYTCELTICRESQEFSLIIKLSGQVSY